MRDSIMFDEAVEEYFAPIARESKLPLVKVDDGVYDILSPHFILRVRLHTGHRRGFNVMLRQASMRQFNENEPFVQYGIGCFMELYGEDLTHTFIDVNSDEDFIRQARLLSDATRRYAVPYLTGEGRDFQTVQERVKEQADKRIEEIKKYRFPNNVREKWN